MIKYIILRKEKYIIFYWQKFKTHPFNFHIFSIQLSNFQFYQFSHLTFNFCQFKAPLLLVLLLLLNSLYDAILHVCFIFYFFNSELKEKSGEKKKKENIKGDDVVVPLPKFISQSL